MQSYCRPYSTANKTFSNQTRIPPLPIPSLASTAARYKRSLLPLLSRADYDQVSVKIDRFFNSDLAGKLQTRLEDLDRHETAAGLNWLDRLWLQKAYLEYREPTLSNVNWWNQFRDPIQGLGQAAPDGQTTEAQLQRAANLMFWLIDYSNKVNAEEIPPDVTRSGEPFCMHQLKSMFGTSRIAAAPGSDRVMRQWPCLANHVNVIYQDQIFSVDVIGEHGETVPIEQLRDQLRDVVKQVEEAKERQASISILTTEHRDTWGQIRQEMEKEPQNAKSFKNIDNSLFVLCLDDYSSPLDLDLAHRNIFHGRNGHNRWFDKALQFIVENNGRAGINGEHSPADAVIPSRIVDYALERESNKDSTGTVTRVTSLKKPQLLTWQVSSKVGEAIGTAEQNAAKLIDTLDSVLLHYNEYGSNLMKQAKVSPDGWLQMVYQLAYYRQYQKPCPTYESASTRKFIAGRTETVRSCSLESVEFTKAWDNKDLKMSEKLNYLNKAITAHLDYMKAASNGQGIDRHLLGLRCQMKPEEGESSEAAMFHDPSYWGSQYWCLSTSNTSPGNLTWGGFGPVVPEGYGINYAIGKEHVRMSVSSRKTFPETDSTSFRKTIREVLDEFGDVAERYLVKK
ncbi:MAG: acyltransferase ChoActase/COT/CPT [Benjaminiella poitrasii]|nr:MAG: acyltransferase ChoActase/COT/CPT [Benjaminiella poitrasii]